MLEFIDDIIEMRDWDWEPDSIRILKAIRALIPEYFKMKKGQPKVSREFVDKLFCKYGTEKMAPNLGGFPNDLFVVLNRKQFYAMLRELGFDV